MTAPPTARSNGSAPSPQNGPPEPPPRGVTTQLAYSGTPRDWDGRAKPDDYVTELLDPQRRMRSFEEMGTDDAIGIALKARSQEVNAANWNLNTEDQSDDGRQIMEFCEDNIYPVLPSLLQWLGMDPLQYGFVALEPVFAWSDRPFTSSITRGEVARPTRDLGERMIYLRRLAHIRQTVVTGFNLDDDGELISMRQEVFDGRQFHAADIPAEKLLLRVYDRRGDDYFGYPPLRRLYKAWKFKSQIEKLGVLHFDKFGVGIPVAEEPEGGLQANERKLLAEFLGALRSGTDNYAMVPFGSKVSILTAEGSIASAALDWVKHYNLQMAKEYLTQATELGSTETGARALGESFFEQLGVIVQADCEDIANIINNDLIVRLVNWNFGPREVYPCFNPSQTVHAGAATVAAIKTMLDGGMIHARPEDEVWVRDHLEMPPVDLDTLRAETDARKAIADRIANAAATNDNADGEDGDGEPTDEKPPSTSARRAPPPPPPPAARKAASHGVTPAHDRVRLLALAAAAPPLAEGATTYRTPALSTWEQRILAPDVLVRDLDLATVRLTAEVADVLRDIDADLARQVEALAVRGPHAMAAGVRGVVVPEKLKRQLRKVMLDAATRARVYGSAAVRQEVVRQQAPDTLGPARERPIPASDLSAPASFRKFTSSFTSSVMRLIRALASTDDEEQSETPLDIKLAAEIDRAVENEVDRREAAARSSMQATLSQAAAATAQILAAVALGTLNNKLTDLSTGVTEQNVSGVVNVGFGIGRTEAAQAINAEAGAPIPAASQQTTSAAASAAARTVGPITLDTKIYSCVMDVNSCDECRRFDGAEFPIDFPEDYTGLQAPNPRCAGTEARCRCVYIYRPAAA